MKRKGRLPREISSRRERRARETECGADPRFNTIGFNPLRHVENYQFLYDKEKEQVFEQQKKGNVSKIQQSRIEARDRLIKEKKAEKERKELEIDLVKQGKKPFYISSKQKRLIRSIETAKEKGVDHTVRIIKKKEKEKENRSRRLLDEV